jgi:hypothetical protein
MAGAGVLGVPTEAITVLLRLRPLTEQQTQNGEACLFDVQQDGCSVTVRAPEEGVPTHVVASAAAATASTPSTPRSRQSRK